MFVRAMRTGFFKHLKEVGDRFEIPDYLYSSAWHEEVKSLDRNDTATVPEEESLAKRELARSTMKEFRPKDPQKDLLAAVAKLTKAERTALLHAAEKVDDVEEIKPKKHPEHK